MDRYQLEEAVWELIDKESGDMERGNYSELLHDIIDAAEGRLNAMDADGYEEED